MQTLLRVVVFRNTFNEPSAAYLINNNIIINITLRTTVIIQVLTRYNVPMILYIDQRV